MRLRSLFFLFPLLLAACGDLPEPFLGNPGANGRILATPVAPILAIPPTADTLLGVSANRVFAEALAVKLQNADILAQVRTPAKHDWKLIVTATPQGDKIVPHYEVIDPAGQKEGTVDGIPLPAAAWGAGTPAVLTQATDEAVPAIAAMLTGIRRARDRANPDSLLNRVAKLYVPWVSGAPGDGNVVLTTLIRDRLKDLGNLVQLTPDAADFTVQGEVTMGPLPAGKQSVKIVWTVTHPGGGLSGKVSQLNDIPAGALDHYWGEVADAVTREASGGIDTVVQRYVGREPARAAAK